MGKFIEEFYYGNLDPQARSTKQNKAVQKQMEVLILNEDYLTENLSGESKKNSLSSSMLGVLLMVSLISTVLLWGFGLGPTSPMTPLYQTKHHFRTY